MPSLPRVRPAIARMAGYTPGEQPAPGTRVIKLNTNENPYPPSPRVMDALRTLPPEALRRYPNPTADAFRDAAAQLSGLSRDHIIAGNGSDDILTILVRTFLDAGERLACVDPTYSLYEILAGLQGAQVVNVPWAPGAQLPIEALAASGARAVFFANPNAPTGTLVPHEQVRALAGRFDGAILVDEAYVDFAAPGATCVPLLAGCPNVIISRTLSKAYSLAGLRFGYALAHPSLVAEMMKVKDSYNCDAVSIAAAKAAIEDQEYARATWAKVVAERTRVTAELARRGWDVTPSHANFVFARPPAGNARDIYRALKIRGVLVRYFDRPGLDDRLRISIGAPDENAALLAGLDAAPVSAA